MKTVKIPRVIIGACGSESGKTMITCGILQVFMNRQLKTASYKCGPDYIDPMFHSSIIGTKSRNLDSFFTKEATTRFLFARNAVDMDIAVIEGVMGYYDGLGVTDTLASTYEMAGILESPAILIVNAKGMSKSVVPIIKGFLEYKNDSKIQGVILNKVSANFYGTMKNMIEEELLVKVLGYVPDLDNMKMESRHLGLIAPEEIPNLKNQMQKLAGILEQTLDIEAILHLARQASGLNYEEPVIPKLKKEVCIGVAKDEAFSFYYEDNMDLFTQMGAKLCYFSPLHDKQLPQGINGLWLGGGYPERFAKQLSENDSMRQNIKEAVESGMPCVAECGGFLYLHKELESDQPGEFGKRMTYPMVGIINACAYQTSHLVRFGYITLECQKNSVLGVKETKFPAHEFHYWESENPGTDYEAENLHKKEKYSCIHVKENLMAGFPHMYLYSNMEGAFCYLKACEVYKTQRKVEEDR